MQTVNMHEAKTRLSALVKSALEGEDVVIAKAGTPLVRLVPYQKRVAPRTPGRLKGRIRIAADFDDIDDDIVELFEQGQ